MNDYGVSNTRDQEKTQKSLEEVCPEVPADEKSIFPWLAKRSELEQDKYVGWKRGSKMLT